MIAKDILNKIQVNDKSDKQKISKTLSLIDSLAFLWPDLVPTKKVDGDAQAILDAVTQIKAIY